MWFLVTYVYAKAVSFASNKRRVLRANHNLIEYLPCGIVNTAKVSARHVKMHSVVLEKELSPLRTTRKLVCRTRLTPHSTIGS